MSASPNQSISDELEPHVSNRTNTTDLEVIAQATSPSEHELIPSSPLTFIGDDGQYVTLDIYDEAAMRLLEGALSGSESAISNEIRSIRIAAGMLTNPVFEIDGGTEPIDVALAATESETPIDALNEKIPEEEEENDPKQSRFGPLNLDLFAALPSRFGSSSADSDSLDEANIESILDEIPTEDGSVRDTSASDFFASSFGFQNVVHNESDIDSTEVVSSRVEVASTIALSDSFSSALLVSAEVPTIIQADSASLYVNDDGNLSIADVILMDESAFSTRSEFDQSIVDLSQSVAGMVDFAYFNDNVDVGDFLFSSLDPATGDANLPTRSDGTPGYSEDLAREVALQFGESLISFLDPVIVEEYSCPVMMMDWYVGNLVDTMPGLFPIEDIYTWDQNAESREEYVARIDTQSLDITIDDLVTTDNAIVVRTDIGEINLSDDSNIATRPSPSVTPSGFDEIQESEIAAAMPTPEEVEATAV